METIINEYLGNIRLGDSREFKNLQIFPIFSDTGHDWKYLSLKEAYNTDSIVISEVSEGGSVPVLKVLNKGDMPVLLLDGEELAGSKQNRVVNSSVLLGKRSETRVNVSCTEEGRWDYRSKTFTDSELIMSPEIRGKKTRSVSFSLENNRGHSSDQQEVWNGIEDLASKTGVFSDTGAMKDIHTTKNLETDNVLSSFPLKPGQTGLLAVINGKIAGLDIVSLDSVYMNIHNKLLKSYAVQILADSKDRSSGVSKEDAFQFIKKAGRTYLEKYKSNGLGWDLRFKGEKSIGSALCLDKDIIHIAFFPDEVFPTNKTHE